MDTYRPPRRVDAKAEDRQSIRCPVDAQGLRGDGRSATQLRPVFLKVGVISQAQGSAYVEISNTKVICGVYGPRQTGRAQYSDKGRLVCDLRFAPFALHSRRDPKLRTFTPEERSYSLLLSEALQLSLMLEKFPKSVLEAYVQVLEAGSGTLGAAVTCVSLALADAGLEMYDLAAGCEGAVLDDRVVMDPTPDEERHQSHRGSLFLAYLPSLRQVTYLRQQGEVEERQLEELVDLCAEACSHIQALMRNCLATSAVIKHRKTVEGGRAFGEERGL